MKLRVLLATIVGTLAFAGTATAHEVPGGFTFNLTGNWFDVDDQKMTDLTAAANQRRAAGAATAEPTRCKGGMAGEFPCENIHLLSHMPLEEIGGGEAGNDMWGWVDQKTKREYAIVGKTNGTAFVDISNPRNPRLIAHLPTQVEGTRRFWRDMKVYKDHAFVVSEHIGHGMQVFDLTRLRDIKRRDQPMTVSADTVYTGVSNTHNIDINVDSGFAYLVGTNTCGNGEENGGLHMVDIRDPLNPTFAGCAIVADADGNEETESNNYVHDSQCVIYDGPDERFAGREICFGSNENAVVIYDVTNKAAPVVLSQTTYPTAVYTHQGWLAKDSRYFVFNDEGDEDGFGAPPTVDRQTTYILPVGDLMSPGTVMASPNNTTSTDHNLYIEDEVIYESNYTSGLRLFDEDTVPSGDLEEIGYFDVYPENDNPGFEGGTWSNYPFYRDKDVVAVSTLDRGLFVLETDLGKRGR
jgi:choice-of-anchor B domain-containing protein